MRVFKQLSVLLICLLTLVACSTTQPDENDVDAGVDKDKPVDYREAASINIQLGMAYLRQGNTSRAKGKLLKAVKQQPEWPPALNAMAYFLEQTGNPGEAEQYYKKAIDISPRSGSAQNNYGTFLCRQKRYPEADEHFNKAISSPNYVKSAEAYENAGLCAVSAGQARKAERYFVRAVEQDPKRYNALLELSELTYKRGDYFKSQDYYNRYMTSGRDTPQSLWLGIRLAEHFGDDKAVARFALELKGKFPRSREYIKYQQSGISS